jgi:hypothetical protein
MKPIAYLLTGICLSLVFCFAYLNFNFTSSAQKISRIQWEYASITNAYSFNPAKDKLNKIYGMAEICYLQGNGCKRAEIKFDLDYGTYLQDRALQETFESRRDASIKASEIAFQKAVSQLGNEGWEIVGAPELKYEFINIDEYNKFEDKSVLFNRNDAKAVYFKRLKTQ